MAGIFKAYDIRGIYPETINEDIVYKIGRAYAIKFKPKNVALGRDMRLSSPSLFRALAKGLADQGCNVIDIGLVSTPMMYFAVWNYKLGGGLTISASHNPKQYNGIKMVKQDSIPISGETGIYEIEKMIESLPELPHKKGIVKKKPVLNDYIRHSLGYINKAKLKHFKIAIDTANGMAGPKSREFFRHLSCELIHLYPELDGSFPNHEANPLKDENNADLKKAVLENNCDIGIAWDGDADRCAFIDEKGNTISSDLIIALVAKSILKERPGAKILADVRCSRIVEEVVRENSGIPGRCRVGHSLIKEMMRKENAYFAGELSSHFYLEDEHYAEAPFFVISKVLEIMSEENKPLSELIRPLKKYFQSGEINSQVKDKKAKIKELAKKYSNAKISYLDGITIEYKDWWFNVRPSNTEPYLRLNLEAESETLLKEKIEEVLKIIRE